MPHADDPEGLLETPDITESTDQQPVPDGSIVRDPGRGRIADVSANGIRFHIVEAGTGPLIILLHGFGQYWRSWRYQIPGLAAGRIPGRRAGPARLRGHRQDANAV